MDLVVAGANGHIGRRLVRLLAEQDHRARGPGTGAVAVAPSLPDGGSLPRGHAPIAQALRDL